MSRQSVTLPLREPVTATNYNEANQMLRYNASSDNISYDENGNMASITNACGTSNYTWDARNRLAGINGFKPDCSPLTASFKYDALGRRIERTVNGRTIQYLYDGLDIVQEIESGVVSANYMRTLNIDEPLARIKSDATVRYYQQDALGSVIALTDETGVIRTQYFYDPYGNTTVSGEISGNLFQYTGRENDGIGLYYYRARYYSPELQRFISEDPIGFKGGMNFYNYVNNRPTVIIDPYGLYIIAPGAGGPLDTRTDIALRCFENCIGKEVTVTGARESGHPHEPGSAHETGQACDLGKNNNRDLNRNDVERCFNQCSGPNFPIGPLYSLSETLNLLSTAPNDRGFTWGYEGSPNYHLQTRPGRGGATGFAPGRK